MRKFSLTIILLSLIFTASGCAVLLIGAIAGASGVVYVKGSLEKNLDKPVADVHRASLAGLKKIKMTILEDTSDQHNGHIVAEDQEKKKVIVEIQALTEKASKLKIRVGIFGDQIRSQMVLNAIQRKL